MANHKKKRACRNKIEHNFIDGVTAWGGPLVKRKQQYFLGKINHAEISDIGDQNHGLEGSIKAGEQINIHNVNILGGQLIVNSAPVQHLVVVLLLRVVKLVEGPEIVP